MLLRNTDSIFYFLHNNKYYCKICGTFFLSDRWFLCPISLVKSYIKGRIKTIKDSRYSRHMPQQKKNSFYYHWPTSWFIVRNFSTINCWFAFYFKWWRVVVNWFRKSLLMLSWKKGVLQKWSDFDMNNYLISRKLKEYLVW